MHETMDKFRVDFLLEFLLKDIDSQEQIGLKKRWNSQISKLMESGKEAYGEDEYEDTVMFFIKSWLLSQYAPIIHSDEKINSARESIEKNFNLWIKKNQVLLGLSDIKGCKELIEEFVFYSNWFIRYLNATYEKQDGLEYVLYSDQLGFEDQCNILLAPLDPRDNEETSIVKLNWTAKFVEIMLMHELWQGGNVEGTNFGKDMLLLIFKFHRKSLDELKDIFYQILIDDRENDRKFEDNFEFGLGQQNGELIRSILARLSDFVDTQSGRESRYEEYFEFDIEHIWPASFKKYKEENDDFENDKDDFNLYRECISGLILLPSSINRSLGDKSYSEKLEVYRGQNLFAKSLHEDSYVHDLKFLKFIEGLKLKEQSKFGPFEKFGWKESDMRYRAIVKIAENIWNPEDFKSLKSTPAKREGTKIKESTKTTEFGEYLLEKIDTQNQECARTIWQTQISKLIDAGIKAYEIDEAEETDLEFLKLWIGSQCIPRTLESNTDKLPDFEFEDVKLHEWLDENSSSLGLTDSQSYFDFLREFEFYSNVYILILQASTKITDGLEHIRYNDWLEFETQYTLLLSPLDPTDSDEKIMDKLFLTAKFIEIKLMIQIWRNHGNIDSTDFINNMLKISCEIHRKNPLDLIIKFQEILVTEIGNEQTFPNDLSFGLGKQKKAIIHSILVRLTDYVTEQAGFNSRYEEFLDFELANIWPESSDGNEYEEFKKDEKELTKYRDLISCLVLLPNQVNKSLNKKTTKYLERLEEYRGQNVLARLLHPKCAESDPELRRLIEELNLFENQDDVLGYKEFGKSECKKRYEDIVKIANRIWNPHDFDMLL